MIGSNAKQKLKSENINTNAWKSLPYFTVHCSAIVLLYMHVWITSHWGGYSNLAAYAYTNWEELVGIYRRWQIESVSKNSLESR